MSDEFKQPRKGESWTEFDLRLKKEKEEARDKARAEAAARVAPAVPKPKPKKKPRRVPPPRPPRKKYTPKPKEEAPAVEKRDNKVPGA